MDTNKTIAEQLKDNISDNTSKKIDITNKNTSVLSAADKEAVRDEHGRSHAVGGRKSAKARVWVKPGKGQITVNAKNVDDYFKRSTLCMIIRQPLKITQSENFDVYATVKGSGLSGQADAVKHAIAKALALYDPESNYKNLRQAGFLTRDSRIVERKKYGRKKARKKFQFSKR